MSTTINVLYADTHTADLVIGSDTVVVNNNKILEKPSSAEHATEMLTSLSGSTHQVFSGVTLVYNRKTLLSSSPVLSSSDASSTTFSEDPTVLTFYEVTDVSFLPLSPEMISGYIATKEPFDKAGGYGIQGIGGDFVKGINGCYYNVMGFPRSHFASVLHELLSGAK